jgi:hypothetical protein
MQQDLHFVTGHLIGPDDQLNQPAVAAMSLQQRQGLGQVVNRMNYHSHLLGLHAVNGIAPGTTSEQQLQNPATFAGASITQGQLPAGIQVEMPPGADPGLFELMRQHGLAAGFSRWFQADPLTRGLILGGVALGVAGLVGSLAGGGLLPGLVGAAGLGGALYLGGGFRGLYDQLAVGGGAATITCRMDPTAVDFAGYTTSRTG